MAVDFPKKVIHGGIGKLQREKTHENVLDFSASVNPFPPKVNWHCDPASLAAYPDDSYAALKERIGSVFHRNPDEICVGNGSIELIRVFCSVVLGHSGNTRTFYTDTPTFGEYDLSARLAGARRTEDPGRADVRFVCNPNNPDGALLRREEVLEMLATGIARRAILFCDEAFIALAEGGESLAGTRDPGLFVLHSLTKSFAVPGIRFGFGFGDPSLVEQIETARSPWCVNAYAEAFAMEALLHLDDLADSRRAIGRERDRLIAEVTGLGLACRPSSANYLLVDCGREVPSLCSELARRNILVRDCTSFGLPTCIRIAVRRSGENDRLIEALGSCVR